MLSRDDNREPSVNEENELLEEMGYRGSSGAKVVDPITNSLVEAFDMPLLVSRTNASRNPIRNE